MTSHQSDAPSGPSGPADPSPPARPIRRGFALLSPEQRRAVASKGGLAVLPANRSFSKSPSLAREAGSLGGKASKGRKPPPTE